MADEQPEEQGEKEPQQEPATEPPKRTLTFGAQRGKKQAKRARIDAHAQKIREAQAKLMLAERIQGRSMGDIAKMFNMSKNTVIHRLTMPEIQQFYDAAKEVVATRLVPMALEVSLEKMELDRDGDMAREVLFGAGVLSKNIRVDNTHSVKEEDFDDWRRRRMEGGTERALPAASEGGAARGPHGGIIDIESQQAPEAPPLPPPDDFVL